MPRKKKNKYYFTQETEDAIVAYVNENSYAERNRIYEEKIQYSFDKLAENIINTFKFQYFDIPFEDLKHEVVAFMLINIEKYNQNKGKAFSYFSIVAKNYLILNNNNNYKKFKIHDDLDVVDEVYDFTIDEMARDTDVYNKELISNMIPYFEGKLQFIFKHQRDIAIADCVLHLFKNIDDIESFNKKSLYFTIREMTNAKTQQITKVINVMKVYYLKVRKEYQNTGDIQSENLFVYE